MGLRNFYLSLVLYAVVVWNCWLGYYLINSSNSNSVTVTAGESEVLFFDVYKWGFAPY